MAPTRKQNVAPIYLEPGHTVTCKAAAAITGSRFVKAAAGGLGNHPAVAPATAGGAAYGVAHYDVPSGAQVSVIRQGTVGVVAGEALTSGDLVAVGADAKAVKPTAATTDGETITAGSIVVGTCVADTASGAVAPITLA